MFKKGARIFGNIFKSPKRIYLDYASATPVHPEVLRAMQPYFNIDWANPGAIHEEGVRARTAVENARKTVARTLRVRAEDVIFTSGGTESNNLALIGFVSALHAKGIAYADMEIITTTIEHPSILEALSYLTERGVRTIFAPVDEFGCMDMQIFPKLFSPKTVLVTAAYVNSEVGVVQDVKKITRTVRAWNTTQGASVRTHVDASQAPLWLSCALDMLGVDLLTLDAGKCYGPKGVGVLVRRHTVSLHTLTHGGGQEGGMRSGTENVPLIVGCAHAIERAQAGYEERARTATRIREKAFELFTARIPECVINGSREHRVANNINISIAGYDSEYAVIWLDAGGVSASTKSACGVGKGNGSDVVRALTKDEARALSTIRFTLGEETTMGDIERVVSCLRTHIDRMRSTL